VPNESLPKGGRISGCYSSDEGQTWTKAETIIDTPFDDRDPSVVQLPDGRILLTFFTYVPQPGKRAHTETLISESNDNGKTWSEPKKLFEEIPVSQPIRILSDGTLLMPLYLFNNQQSSGAVSLSYDNGKTWSEVIVIPNGGHQLDAETDVIDLKGGTLYAIQRPWMGVSYSKDKGKTWSVSEHAGFEGHCPYLLRTKNDVILLATRSPNTSIRISRDECKTWSAPILVDHFIGAYPSMVELKDGSILIVYYEEGAGSSIRAKRFRVKDGENAVDWLPLD
jgi:Neuraminidase (sialidase)